MVQTQITRKFHDMGIRKNIMLLFQSFCTLVNVTRLNGQSHSKDVSFNRQSEFRQVESLDKTLIYKLCFATAVQFAAAWCYEIHIYITKYCNITEMSEMYARKYNWINKTS